MPTRPRHRSRGYMLKADRIALRRELAQLLPSLGFTCTRPPDQWSTCGEWSIDLDATHRAELVVHPRIDDDGSAPWIACQFSRHYRLAYDDLARLFGCNPVGKCNWLAPERMTAADALASIHRHLTYLCTFPEPTPCPAPSRLSTL